jgi:hypothetical protein
MFGLANDGLHEAAGKTPKNPWAGRALNNLLHKIVNVRKFCKNAFYVAALLRTHSLNRYRVISPKFIWAPCAVYVHSCTHWLISYHIIGSYEGAIGQQDRSTTSLYDAALLCTEVYFRPHNKNATTATSGPF